MPHTVMKESGSSDYRPYSAAIIKVSNYSLQNVFMDLVEMVGRTTVLHLITNTEFKREGPARPLNLNTGTAGKTDEVMMTTILHYFYGSRSS